MIYRKSEIKPETLLMIKKMYKLLRKSDHPNIIKIENAYEDMSKLYFVIEDLEGPSLFDLVMDQGKLTEAAAQHIMTQLLSVFQFLAKRGLCVRHLPLENIYFSEPDNV